ncbi:MAG: diacylglycerol kinase family lipid kinase [Chloroflexi bacterium]|nr:diacylglycerol kinase family lipid kinase [Chloroflexota bacterium]
MNAALICNPTAGKFDGNGSIDAGVRVLEQAGWALSLHYTGGPGDATEIARRAACDGLDAVVVAGGDGTLNEAIQGLAHSGTALGYLPYGTVNVWAREVGIPLEIEGAARALAGGRIERVDLGRADDRYFLLMAGIGFDGEVLRRAHSVERFKARFGVLPYVAVTLSSIPLYRGADLELRYDGIIRRVQTLMLVLGNTRLYGGYFHLTPHAVANDGWLDLCVIKGRGPISFARQSLPILLSRSVAHADVEMLRVRDLLVQAPERLPLQVDGELVGTTPTHFRVAPRALQAIVPRDFASTLLG